MSNPAEAPHIEALLDAAHRNLAVLRERCEALSNAGVDPNHLPDERSLMAFTLLGDHERKQRLAALRSHWAGLQSRGFASGNLDAAPTPLLRLMSHVREYTESVGTIWEQMISSTESMEATDEVLQCTCQVIALWGQPVRLHFTARTVDFVLIDPDPVFGLQPALLSLDPQASHSGHFEIPADRGKVRIRLRGPQGRIYHREIEVKVEAL